MDISKPKSRLSQIVNLFRNNIIITCLIFVSSFISLVSCDFKEDNFMNDITMAISYKEKGDYKEALNYVNKSILIDSNKSFSFVLQGQIESSLEDDVAAIKSFAKAINLNQSNVSAYFYKALSFSLLNSFDSAIENFNKAIDIKQGVGKVYIEINNEHLPFEEQLNVPMYEIKYFRGLTFININKYYEALNDFEFSLLNHYMNSNCQYYIGAIYSKLGNKEKACTYLMQAKNGGNQDAEKIINKYCK